VEEFGRKGRRRMTCGRKWETNVRCKSFHVFSSLSLLLLLLYYYIHLVIFLFGLERDKKIWKKYEWVNKGPMGYISSLYNIQLSYLNLI